MTKNIKVNLLLLLTVMTMDLLAGMEFDLFVPSFPELQNHFHITPFLIEAALSINFIGYCFGLFTAGDLADRYDRKSIILLGLTLFIVGSLLCLFTLTYNLFLIGRFFQGLGVAAPAMLSFLIIADTYPLKQQQFLLSIMNGVMNISVAIAPVIGSYITHYFHWQGNFRALLLLGVITFIMTITFVPAIKLKKSHEELSLYGYIRIFQNKNLLLIILCLMCMFVPYWIFVGISPLLYMKNLGVSLTHFGFYQGVLSLVFALGCILSSTFIHKYKQQNLLSLSNLILIFSLICVIALVMLNIKNPLILTIAFLPFIIGHVLPSNLLFPVALNILPHAKGHITAILQGGRLVFASLSLQLAGFFYDGTFRTTGIIISCFIGFTIVFLFLVIRQNIRNS